MSFRTCQAQARLDLESAVLVEKKSLFTLCEWKFCGEGVDFKLQRLTLNGHCYFFLCHCSDRHSTINAAIYMKDADDSELVIKFASLGVTNDYQFLRYKQFIEDISRHSCLSKTIYIAIAFHLPVSKVFEIGASSKCLQMLHDKTLVDCIFKIGDNEIRAHRCLLAQNSKVFHAMFSQESTSEAKNGVIEIKDSDCVSVNTMLKYMYSGSVKLSGENVEGVIFLAEKYDVQPLRKACIEFLIGIVDGTNVVRMAVIGDLYSSSDIIEKCGKYLKKNRPAILDSNEWKELKNTNHKLVMRLFELMY